MEAVGDIAQRVKLLQTSSDFRGAAIFDKVRTQHLRKLAMAAERVEYASGETVISIGERGDALYIVVSGECSVDLNGIAGGRMSAGTSFGELALITDDKTLLERTATVRAVDDCVLLRIHARKVQAILDSIWGGKRPPLPLRLPSCPLTVVILIRLWAQETRSFSVVESCWGKSPFLSGCLQVNCCSSPLCLTR